MTRLPLGKRVKHPSGYDPSVLYPVERTLQPGVFGYDLWRAYELSWLNEKGRPMAGILEMAYDAGSRRIVESKSLKLYLSGLAWERFPSAGRLEAVIARDVGAIVEPGWIDVRITQPDGFAAFLPLVGPKAAPLDTLDVEMQDFDLDPALLSTRQDVVEEALYSDLLRTVCPITSQPDWATVLVRYKGRAIERAGLLRYLCSYRSHAGFAEDVCSHIYRDIAGRCRPETLSVTCFYTRRGGIDITAHRCGVRVTARDVERTRLVRQ